MARHRKRQPDDDEDDLPRTPVTGATLREAGRLLRYLWPYRVKFVAALVALFVSSLLGLAIPYLAGLLVNSALAPRAPGVPAPFPRPVNAVALALVGVLTLQAA